MENKTFCNTQIIVYVIYNTYNITVKALQSQQ